MKRFGFVVVSSWHSQLRVKFLSNFSRGLGSFPRTRRLHQVSSELSCTNPSTLDKLLTGYANSTTKNGREIRLNGRRFSGTKLALPFQLKNKLVSDPSPIKANQS